MVDKASLSDEKIWRVRDHLHYRSLVDGGMLYDEGEATVHHLNATAALVWEGCERGESTRQLIKDMCVLYNANGDAVRIDVEALLSEFIENGLLI
ncbi:MAG: hypothetical protein ACI906_001073 [Candidatus Latescibacterota bacterium]|jgi:hypothetical protein